MTTPTPLEAAARAVCGLMDVNRSADEPVWVTRGNADFPGHRWEWFADTARAAILAFIGALDGEEIAQAVREARDRHHREPGDLWYDSDEARAVLTHLKSKVET